jgi:ABC-type protease/lipase transport system fused ATPase/permease subunit
MVALKSWADMVVSGYLAAPAAFAQTALLETGDWRFAYLAKARFLMLLQVTSPAGARIPNGQSASSELNLPFQSGERVGLLGHPGSGKFTLLCILAEAIQPTHGEVRVDHAALHGFAPQNRLSWPRGYCD